MIRNYLLIAWRNLKRNKIFSVINILGLALGMACSLFIFLWIEDENNMDHFNINSNHLFSVYERQYYDNKIDAFHATPGIMADEMAKVLPEVQYASSFAWNEKSTFQVGEKILKEEGNHAGKDFFKMFSYKLLQGNSSSALAMPLDIAISRKMANDFFGSPQAAIGKTIRYENRKDLKIQAVYENPGKDASDKFDFLINWNFFLEENSWARDWGNNGPKTFLTLKNNVNPIAFEKKITHFLDKYNKDQSKAFHIELGLQRYDDMYLHSHFSPDGHLEGGRIEYVHLFRIVAIFILLIACINFMNLTTARSVKRAKEIGVRKVVGAVRAVLIRQFIGEAILLSMLAIIFALGLVILLLPLFNGLTHKEIRFPFTESKFWISILVLTFLTGMVAGSYPALFLSSFRPIVVLKGTLKFTSAATSFRKGLVVFQFVLSVILIIGTIVISRQISYVQNKNLGYNRMNLIYVPLEGDLVKKYEFFKQQALNIPGITEISRVSQNPTDINNGTGGVEWDGKDPNSKPMFTQVAVGYDFVKTMGISILQGRDFSKDFSTDSVGYILNEQALKKMNLKDPIGQSLRFWEKKGKIIGIVKDFHFSSLKIPVNALIIHYGEKDNYGTALVRVQAGKSKNAISRLEDLLKNINPNFPFTYTFADDEFHKLYTSEEMVGKLAHCFAFLAIFISCLGLLGLATFTAEQRTKEIGIRKVLGASASSVFNLLSREFLILVFISLVIASPLSWFIMKKWLEDFYYRTEINWWIFGIAAAIAIIIALVTISSQAIKAAMANPIKSLRTE